MWKCTEQKKKKNLHKLKIQTNDRSNHASGNNVDNKIVSEGLEMVWSYIESKIKA